MAARSLIQPNQPIICDGGNVLRELVLIEAFPDKAALGAWRSQYGYQDTTPGKPGRNAETRKLDVGPGICFNILIEQKTRPGLKGYLRIEARPWT